MTTDGRPETIHELADLLGSYRFIELALFGIVGRAVIRAAEPGLAILLSEASHAHAWRAELIERCLLVSDGLPHVAESTKPPSAGHATMLEMLDESGADELGSLLVSVLYPAMVDAYQERRGRCSYATDGPVRLMLDRVIFDLGRSGDQLGRALGMDRWQKECARVRDQLVEIGGPFGTRRL